MKVLIICVGSRGDIEPFCSLTAELLKDCTQNENEIEFFVQPELAHLVPKSTKVHIHELPFTQYDFYKYANNPTKGLDHPNPRVKFIGIVTDVISQMVFPIWNDVLQAANGCDVIITSALARSLSWAISEKVGNNIPTCLIHLQPLVPTTKFPHYSNTPECVEAIMNGRAGGADETNSDESNLESYWKLEDYQHKFLEADLEVLYKEHLKLPQTIDWDKTRSILSGKDPNTWLINAFYCEDEDLIPNILSDDHLGPNVINTGPFADAYIPADFEEPSSDTDLIEFLTTKNPICVGFGSMPFGQVNDIVEVIKELNENAIFVGKALELPKSTSTNETDDNPDNTQWRAEDHIRQVSSLPYAWLLPHCQMMLCHGGAGVVHVTLRAGIPCVIAPLMGDQFTFGELLQAKDLGVRVGSLLPKITKEEWKTAILKAKERKIVNTSKEFGKTVQSQNELGVQRMVRALQEKIVGTDGK